jgi:hypothetical protein
MDAYEAALRVELERYEMYGKADRAAAVRAELARIGAEPTPETAADTTPLETAVLPKRGPGRPRKES